MIDKRILMAFRGLSLGGAVILLGACDDSTGPGGERLRPEDVSAVYNVCEMRFKPNGDIIPEVDLLDIAFQTEGASAPTIGLDPNPQTLELTYVPQGQVNDRELRGSYTLRSLTTVEIRFNNSGVSPTPLLIPADHRLDFEYQESPLALSLASSTQYNVSRLDYAALTGRDPTGLSEQIPGVLAAKFQVGGCST